jgi:hypothetical protein
LIDSIPEEARIFLDNSDRFSNIYEDTNNDRKVIGLRTQKLRGDFTQEERELLKLEYIERKLKNKAAGLSNSGKTIKDK